MTAARHVGRAGWKIGLATLLLVFARAAVAEDVACGAATRIVREVVETMARTARDESTHLRGLVRTGWDAVYDDLVVVQSFRVGECRPASDPSRKRVAVRYQVLGRLVGEGAGARYRFTPGRRTEATTFEVLPAAEGSWMVDDIAWLEPHVDRAYAIGILTELANTDRRRAKAYRQIIRGLR